jgi:replicative DNA helicase
MQIPHSRDAEESLLSCCIKGGEDLVFERVQSSLSTEDFYFEEHQQIWDTLNELSESNTPIDIVTVTELAKGKNDELVHTIINLDCLERSTMVLPEYVKIILNQSKLRTLKREYTLALEKISANTSADDIVNEVNEEIDKLKPQEKDTTHNPG